MSSGRGARSIRITKRKLIALIASGVILATILSPFPKAAAISVVLSSVPQNISANITPNVPVQVEVQLAPGEDLPFDSNVMIIIDEGLPTVQVLNFGVLGNVLAPNPYANLYSYAVPSYGISYSNLYGLSGYMVGPYYAVSAPGYTYGFQPYSYMYGYGYGYGFGISGGTTLLYNVILNISGLQEGTHTIRAVVQSPTTPDDLWPSAQQTFNIDNIPPEVSIAVSDTLISDADAASSTFSVSATYNEAMDTSITPNVSFAPDVSSTLTFASGAWSTGATVYTATYDVADDGVTVPDVDVSVSGAKDLAGNTQSPDPTTTADLFDIDTENPTGTIDVSDPLISDADTGLGKTFEVIVTYTEVMDTSINPTIEFGPDVTIAPISTLSLSTGSWNLDGTIFTATYAVSDNGVNVPDVNINAIGAQDVAGNLQSATSPPGDQPPGVVTLSAGFDIDTLNPVLLASAITFSDDLISDADTGEGKTFTVTSTYSEDMNTSIKPSVVFVKDGSVIDISSTLTLDTLASDWDPLDSKVFRAVYTVDDDGVDVRTINARVDGAEDPAGNAQSPEPSTSVQPTGPTTSDASFAIDTENPTVSISVSDTTISDADVGTGTFTVTATYNEAMDTSITPNVSFAPDVTVGTPPDPPDEGVPPTLTLASGTWTSSTVYTATYDVADANIATSTVPDVDVTIDGGEDLAGNAQSDVPSSSPQPPGPTTATDQFRVDTANPVISLPTDISVGEITIKDGVLVRRGGVFITEIDVPGAIVTYSVSATDAPDGAVTAPCTPVTDSTLGHNDSPNDGSTPITCTAADTAGNSATIIFPIEIHRSDDCTLVTSGSPGNFILRCGEDAWGEISSFAPVRADVTPGTLTVIELQSATLSLRATGGDVELFGPKFQGPARQEEWRVFQVNGPGDFTTDTDITSAFTSSSVSCDGALVTSGKDIANECELTLEYGDLSVRYLFKRTGEVEEFVDFVRSGQLRTQQIVTLQANGAGFGSGVDLSLSPLLADFVAEGNTYARVNDDDGEVLAGSTVTVLGFSGDPDLTGRAKFTLFLSGDTDKNPTGGTATDFDEQTCIEAGHLPSTDTRPCEVFAASFFIPADKEGHTRVKVEFLKDDGQKIGKGKADRNHSFLASGVAGTDVMTLTQDDLLALIIDFQAFDITNICRPVEFDEATGILTGRFVYGCVTPFTDEIHLDPEIATSLLPTLDAYFIKATTANVYARNQGSNSLQIGELSDANQGCNVGDTVGSAGGPCILRGVIEWDISQQAINIPPEAKIHRVSVLYSTDANLPSFPDLLNCTGLTCSIKQIGGTTRPSQVADDNTGNSALWTDAFDGTAYVSSWNPMQNQGNEFEPLTETLGDTDAATSVTDTAVTDFASHLDDGWFAVGLVSDDNAGTDADNTRKVRASEDPTVVDVPGIGPVSIQRPILEIEFTKPVAYWKFDNSADTTPDDSSGNGNTGTITGATYVDAGRIGKALQFDALSERVTVPDSTSLNSPSSTKELTMAFWFKFVTFGEPDGRVPILVQKGTTGITRDYIVFYLTSSDKIRFQMGNNAAVESRDLSTLFTSADIGVWHHFAVTYKDSTKVATYYLDGAQVNTQTFTLSGLLVDTSASVLIGNRPQADNDQIQMDDVRIYDVVLSAGEIDAIFDRGVLGFP